MVDAVLDLGALDSAATTVEATPDATVETPPVESTTPETTTTEPTADTAETKEPTKEEKPADQGQDTAVSLKHVNEKLQEIKKDSPALAKLLHSHVKASLQTQAFLKELGASNLAEAKEKLSTVPAEVEDFRQSVEASDELLYRGNLSELSNNVLNDLEATLGTREAATQRFGQFTEAAYDALKTANKAEAVKFQRGVLVDSLYDSQFPQAINALSQALKGNDTAGAKQIVRELVRWFTDEAKTDDQRREQTKATGEQSKTEATTQSSLRTAVEKDIDYSSNRILGTVFGELMRGPLKSLNRFELEDIATDIRDALSAELKKDAAYQRQWKGKLDKATLLKSHEAKLKTIAKDLVTRIANAKHPSLFAKPTPVVAKPVAAKSTALPTVDVKLDGKSVKAVLLAKRPENRLLDDVSFNGRTYRRSEIEMLQMGKGQGFVKGKSGNPVLVTWRKA